MRDHIVATAPAVGHSNKDHEGAAQVNGIVSRFPACITDHLGFG
ncbi:MAG: hypothetical protein ACK583_10150 [Cyanobacteriota bacterium]